MRECGVLSTSVDLKLPTDCGKKLHGTKERSLFKNYPFSCNLYVIRLESKTKQAFLFQYLFHILDKSLGIFWFGGKFDIFQVFRCSGCFRQAWKFNLYSTKCIYGLFQRLLKYLLQKMI